MKNVTLLRIKIGKLKQVINNQSLTFELYRYIHVYSEETNFNTDFLI